MCLPPSPVLILKTTLKQRKKVSFNIDTNDLPLSDNKSEKHDLVNKHIENCFYKAKLEQFLVYVEELESLLQGCKQRENELLEIIYNLNETLDEQSMKTTDFTFAQPSITNISRRVSLNNLHNTTV